MNAAVAHLEQIAAQVPSVTITPTHSSPRRSRTGRT